MCRCAHRHPQQSAVLNNELGRHRASPSGGGGGGRDGAHSNIGGAGAAGMLAAGQGELQQQLDAARAQLAEVRASLDDTAADAANTIKMLREQLAEERERAAAARAELVEVRVWAQPACVAPLWLARLWAGRGSSFLALANGTLTLLTAHRPRRQPSPQARTALMIERASVVNLQQRLDDFKVAEGHVLAMKGRLEASNSRMRGELDAVSAYGAACACACVGGGAGGEGGARGRFAGACVHVRHRRPPPLTPARS
jgi:hypothetical protein